MEKKLGLSALTALVLSSMLGAGVFSLPQNMAAVASPAALLIGWVITGVGILLLAFAMLLLTRIRPDLDGGIFTYAREGFGELIGFCSAWGYWLCAVIANVSYLVIVFSALSFFTDTPDRVCLAMATPGSRSSARRCCCGWFTGWCCAASRRRPALTCWRRSAKLVPLLLFVVLALLAFNYDRFRFDFDGIALGLPAVGAGEKHHADHTVGVYRCGRRGGGLCPRAAQKRMSGAPRCWRCWRRCGSICW